MDHIDFRAHEIKNQRFLYALFYECDGPVAEALEATLF